jgi:hypothetical protein
MIFTFLLALTGLTLSGVAIYYSVIGLTAIFAAAFWPIVVMGTTLEISKLVAASWLKAKWNIIPGFMKTYMTVAVFVLMFITSMGIFGFLSKAHIEQTSMSTEQVAQIETLDDKIARSQAKIDRWTTDLGRLNRGEDVRVDNLIANEQEGLDKIYARIKNEKDGLRADAKIKVDQQQLRITQAQDRRDSAIAAAEKKFAGSFAGSDEYEKAVQKAKSAELSVASRAQKEILAVNDQLDKDLKAVEGKYANEIATIQKRIQGLRNQANDKTTDIEGKIVELEGYIETEQKKIDDAREEKFVYEKEYRKLEAEVGPIKYIAEFIYGDTADQSLLEKAVTWVIITIIFVFDPLAVLMLLASQMTYAWYKENNNGAINTSEENEDTPEEPDGPSTGGDTTNPRPVPEEQTDNTEQDEEKVDEESDPPPQEEIPEPQEENSSDPDPEPVEEEEKSADEVVDDPTENESKKKVEVEKEVIVESDDDEDYENNDQISANEKSAIHRWKLENPENTIKVQRKLFSLGRIKELPWIKYMQPEDDFPLEDADAIEAAKWAEEQLSKKKISWMEHDEEGQQIKKEGYVQNEEQQQGTLWNQIKGNK